MKLNTLGCGNVFIVDSILSLKNRISLRNELRKKGGGPMGNKANRFLGVILISILFFFLTVDEAIADKVILENGDTLTGTVEKMAEGKLTFKTDYAGIIEIQMGKVKQIITDNPVAVHLTSGEVVKGNVKPAEEGKLAVEPSPERGATTVEMEKIASINPPPKELPKWHGNVNAGGYLQSGNVDRAGGSFSVEALRRTENDRFKLRYIFNYAEEDGSTTARNHYGEIKYDYFFTKKFYGFIDTELLNDKFSDTKLKTFVGPGIGYQLWDDPVKSLLFEAGFSYFNWNRYEGQDTDGISARLGFDFRYNIFKWLSFTDKYVFYPTIGEGGIYFWRNEAALNIPLGEIPSLGGRWSLRFANIIDYNSSPTPGFERMDIQWIGGLQFSF
jgi:putative salt-induced outer membrane protein YdiY